MKLFGWTFYNPFKWHVIRTPMGGYYGRKYYSFGSVEYLGTKGIYLNKYLPDAFTTYSEAINTINTYTAKRKKDEVIHETPKTTN
jgi:hypothetical protein